MFRGEMRPSIATYLYPPTVMAPFEIAATIFATSKSRSVLPNPLQ